jgi:hypothetical protein
VGLKAFNVIKSGCQQSDFVRWCNSCCFGPEVTIHTTWYTFFVTNKWLHSLLRVNLSDCYRPFKGLVCELKRLTTVYIETNIFPTWWLVEIVVGLIQREIILCFHQVLLLINLLWELPLTMYHIRRRNWSLNRWLLREVRLFTHRLELRYIIQILESVLQLRFWYLRNLELVPTLTSTTFAKRLCIIMRILRSSRVG